MKILGVLSLLGASSAFAVTTPSTDIYSDSLTIERASAEVPGSLEASRDSAADEATASVDLDTAVDSNDDQPAESVSEVVRASKPQPKKRARK